TTYTCHCTDCQHLTSSAFSLAITVPDGAFRLTKGEPRLVQKIADSGRVVTRWVCSECGCWLTSSPQPGARPGAMIRRVRGGTLANQETSIKSTTTSASAPLVCSPTLETATTSCTRNKKKAQERARPTVAASGRNGPENTNAIATHPNSLPIVRPLV